MSGFQKIVVKYRALSKWNWTFAAYVELTDDNVRQNKRKVSAWFDPCWFWQMSAFSHSLYFQTWKLQAFRTRPYKQRTCACVIGLLVMHAYVSSSGDCLIWRSCPYSLCQVKVSPEIWPSLADNCNIITVNNLSENNS